MMEITETTIERGELTFRAFRCPTCGGIDARLESLKVHMKRHEVVADIMAGRVWIRRGVGVRSGSGALVAGNEIIRQRAYCKERGCKNLAAARNWCPMHYQRHYGN